MTQARASRDGAGVSEPSSRGSGAVGDPDLRGAPVTDAAVPACWVSRVNSEGGGKGIEIQEGDERWRTRAGGAGVPGGGLVTGGCRGRLPGRWRRFLRRSPAVQPRPDSCGAGVGPGAGKDGEEGRALWASLAWGEGGRRAAGTAGTAGAFSLTPDSSSAPGKAARRSHFAGN